MCFFFLLNQKLEIIYQLIGERYMFRAQVLVGKFTQGSSDYRRPPEIPGESHKLYDACVDSPIDPSIFVVFDRSQTYPEYLIKYTVKTENVMTPSYGVSSPSTTSPTKFVALVFLMEFKEWVELGNPEL
jgi:hypothetical protein